MNPLKSLLSNPEPIIIVDDDIDDHFIIGEVARKMNLSNEIKFFRDGQDVLMYLRTTRDKPFIILCDVNMPQMDGLSLRKTLNSEEYLRRKSIPFVFFSTNANKAQIQEAYDLTVQGFFLKESSMIETERTLRLILEYWDLCKHPNSTS